MSTAACTVDSDISDDEILAISRRITREAIAKNDLQAVSIFFYGSRDEIDREFTVARVIWGLDLSKEPLPLGNYENHSLDLARP